MEKWIVRGGRSLPYIQQHHLHPLLARILAGRIPLEAVPLFLDRNAPLFSPWYMSDMETAVSLVQHHLENGSSIYIVGDYDVDGLTATAILYKGLQGQSPKKEVICRIPERIGEGYGFSVSIAEEIVSAGAQLVITCDNGIRELASAAYLKKQGVDLIVTDHHEIGMTPEGEEELPAAAAIINPHRKGDQSPQKLICGAFVAYQLMRALYEKKGQPLPPELIGYAALGTVCDVMPLQEENRRLVYQGFAALNDKPTAGIAALLQAGDVKELSPYTAGYVIGPMLNAGGRLGSQNRFLEILISDDRQRCQQLAQELFNLNRERQLLTEEGIALGSAQVENELAGDMVKVVYLPQLHESIAGLVAGKIKEKYQRPTFVITKAEQGLKGSGRSVPAYHMFQEMSKVDFLFSKFGGHAMAAGLSIAAAEGEEAEAVKKLRTALAAQCVLTQEDCMPVVYIDAAMPMHQITTELIQLLEDLAPYGTENPRPLLAQKGLLLRRAQLLGKKKNVVRLLLAAEGQAIEAICFEMDLIEKLLHAGGEEMLEEFYEGSYFTRSLSVDVVYQPEIDWYTGVPKAKFLVRHIRISANSICK